MKTHLSPTEAAIEHARQIIRELGGPRKVAKLASLSHETLRQFHLDTWRPTTSTLAKLEGLQQGRAA